MTTTSFTFGTGALPDTAQISSASLAGCYLGGTVANGAELLKTGYTRPFDETAFNGLTAGVVMTMAEPVGGGTSYVIQSVPDAAAHITPTGDRQLTIREKDESCGPDRFHTYDSTFIGVPSCNNQPAGFWHGQRPEQKAVHHAENSGRGAHAERDCERGDEGEARAPSQVPQRKAQILTQVGEPAESRAHC